MTLCTREAVQTSWIVLGGAIVVRENRPQQDSGDIPESAQKKITAASTSVSKATTDLQTIVKGISGLKKQDETSRNLYDQVKQTLKIGLNHGQLLQKMGALGIDENDEDLTFEKIKFLLSEASLAYVYMKIVPHNLTCDGCNR